MRRTWFGNSVAISCLSPEWPWSYATVFDNPMQEQAQSCRTAHYDKMEMMIITAVYALEALFVSVCVYSAGWADLSGSPARQSNSHCMLAWHVAERTCSSVTLGCCCAANLYSGEKAMSLNLGCQSLHCMQGFRVRNKRLLIIVNMGVSQTRPTSSVA